MKEGKIGMLSNIGVANGRKLQSAGFSFSTIYQALTTLLLTVQIVGLIRFGTAFVQRKFRFLLIVLCMKAITRKRGITFLLMTSLRGLKGRELSGEL